jgi:hypothetical protein
MFLAYSLRLADVEGTWISWNEWLFMLFQSPVKSNGSLYLNRLIGSQIWQLGCFGCWGRRFE